MRYTLILVLVLLSASHAAEGAPAPFPRTVRPRAWTPAGEWVLEWRSSDLTFSVTMTPAGDWRCGQWVGVWAWDATARTLHVQERSGSTQYEFLVRLDSDLSGSCSWGRVTYDDGTTGDIAGLHIRLRQP